MLKHTSTYTIPLLRSKAETGAALLKSESENEREREERSLPPSLSLFRPTFDSSLDLSALRRSQTFFAQTFFVLKRFLKKLFRNEIQITNNPSAIF